MHETDFNTLFYGFEHYGLTEEEKESTQEPVVEFDFANELHREYLCWSNEFTFAHLKVGDGAMTVGGTRVGDKLYYAVALCSPEDNFSKAKGRAYIREHIQYPEHSKKRGVLKLAPEAGELPPAIILKTAAELYLSKMSHKPAWARKATVHFRTERRADKKRRREGRLP